MMDKFDVYFYMKGGHVVRAPDVAKLEMKSGPEGDYVGYAISWANPEKKPKFFSLSIPDIVAVSTAKP